MRASLLELQARRQRQRVALWMNGEAVTYQDLARRANAVADALRPLGLSSGARVGLLLDKCPASIVAMFGVLKTDAVYVPLDPRGSLSRLARLIEVTGMAGLICDGERLTQLTEAGIAPARVAVLEQRAVGGRDLLVAVWAARDREHGPAALPPGLATILFTSGSTGVPKGVMLTERNILAFLRWATLRFAIRAHDRCVSHAPLHFDLSLFDVFATLAAGGRVVLIPDRHASNPRYIVRLLEEQRATVWQSVPSVLTLLLNSGTLEGRNLGRMRAVLFAGETLSVRSLLDLMRHFDRATFYNIYGCTETNDTFCYQVPEHGMPIPNPVPIGKPLPYVSYRVIGENRETLKRGREGELVVHAPTVMAGYWGEEKNSSDVFITLPDEHANDIIYYRTRDRVREAPDGEILFLGRTDTIVKRKGHRVNLLEVEHALATHSAIAETAVIDIPDEDRGTRLVAFVVANAPAQLTVLGLREHCAQSLPAYMIPERFEMRMTALPKTSNDKVDRRALRDSTHLREA